MKKLTTEQWIEKARVVHGDKYDYSKVDYQGSKTKVCIICPEHGEFWQCPADHINKKCECPKCGNINRRRNQKLTTQEFIEKAQKVHGDKYDYSKVVYNGAHDKVCIICPEHGEFWMKPNNHLSGQNCPKCALIKNGLNQRKSTEQFINLAKEIHKNKYDYSLVNYIKSTIPVTIICPKHGKFEQSPNSHLQGCGCPKCAYEKIALKNTKSTELFIKQASLVHNNFYNYNKTIYNKAQEKIIITCPIHGDFEQVAYAHLQGQGCPKCANKNVTTEEFIEKAKKIHSDKYSYDKVNYINNITKVIITCPVHGDFEQTPNQHLNGRGCPKCVQSKGESIIEGYLKLNNINYIYQYNIPINTDINSTGKCAIDFYLPDYDLYIEFNGMQHYMPIEHFGGELKFQWQQKRDNYVIEYCKDKLLEIKFTESKNKIYNLINEFIKRNNKFHKNNSTT